MPRSQEFDGTLVTCRLQEVSKRDGTFVSNILTNCCRRHDATDIHVPAKKQLVRFHIDSTTDHFAAANLLWDKIDEAFDDIDSEC